MIFALLRFLFWGGLLGVGTVAGVVMYYSRDLPSPSKLSEYKPATVTRLYANDGSMFKEYAREHRIYTPIQSVPQVVIDAFVAAEDRNFFIHSGIDPMGILRAMVSNLSSGTKQGASTITQQVIKNILLTKDRTMERKIKEAILAFQLTAVYSKEEVLELYLNHIFLGARSYGVGSAALHYFNKSLDQITPEEAALMAAMPKAPAALSPWRHYERALHRRNWVLSRMHDENFITDEQYETYVKTPLNLAERQDKYAIEADYFAEEVRRQFVDMWGEDKMYEDGFSIHTTLQPTLQNAAEKALLKGLVSYDRRYGYRGGFAKIPVASFKDGTWREKFNDIPLPHIADVLGWDMYLITSLDGGQATLVDEKGTEIKVSHATIKHRKGLHNVGDVILMSKGESGYRVEEIPAVNGAMLVMDPQNGNVLAMVGGHSPDLSHYNRATQAKRQPGSSFKPFTYAAALERGFTPASLVADEPFTLTVGDQVWSPKNYHGTFYGPITLRDGLERSINVMSVNLAMMTGIRNITEMANRLGAYDEEPAPYLSTVLGTQETTLINMASAYSTFANGGYKITPKLVSRVQDRTGKIVFTPQEYECEHCRVDAKNVDKAGIPVLEESAKPILRPETAYQITHILEGVVDRGTAASLRKYGIPLAAKTGTTNETRDTWIIAYTPTMVMAVFVGFDHPRSLGKNEQSATVAAPIIRNFIEAALEEIPLIPFPVPDGITLVRVDHKNGYLPNNETRAKDVIFEAFVHGTEPTSTVPPEGVRPLTEAPGGGLLDGIFNTDETPPATGVY